MDEIRTYFARNNLYRSTDSRWLGGVCAGLGARFDLSPRAARILFVLALCLVPGSQLLVYPALWVLMPKQGWAPSQSPSSTSYA